MGSGMRRGRTYDTFRVWDPFLAGSGTHDPVTTSLSSCATGKGGKCWLVIHTIELYVILEPEVKGRVTPRRR